jgi:hypothetical protein
VPTLQDAFAEYNAHRLAHLPAGPHIAGMLQRDLVRALGDRPVGDPMPAWMNEPQRHRWLPLYAVSTAILGDTWTRRRHIEDVTDTPGETERLLADIATVRAMFPNSIGILPGTLYDKLRAVNSDLWGELTDTKLGRLVRGIQDADGRQLDKLNVPVHANVAGFDEDRGAKFYPWVHFEAAWSAYGIEQPV